MGFKLRRIWCEDSSDRYCFLSSLLAINYISLGFGFVFLPVAVVAAFLLACRCHQWLRLCDFATCCKLVWNIQYIEQVNATGFPPLVQQHDGSSDR